MRLGHLAIGRDNNFNLIRIAAALAVLVSHCFILPTGRSNDDPLHALTGITVGDLAVDVFFVISGFLISKSALERNSCKFLSARALRIYPALLVMLGITTLALWAAFSQMDLWSFLTHRDSVAYFWRNSTLFPGVTFYLPGIFTENPIWRSVNGSLWTLTWEVRFYVIALAVAMLVKAIPAYSRAGKIASVFLLALALDLYFSPGGIRAPWVKLGVFFAGGMAMYYLREHISLNRWIALLGVIAMAVAASMHVFLPVYMLALPYVVLTCRVISGPVES